MPLFHAVHESSTPRVIQRDSFGDLIVQELPTMGLLGSMRYLDRYLPVFGVVNESTNYIVLASFGTRIPRF